MLARIAFVFFPFVIRSHVHEVLSGMARQPMACTWLSNASSEFLILLLYYILELGRGILEKLVMSVGKRIFYYGMSCMLFFDERKKKVARFAIL